MASKEEKEKNHLKNLHGEPGVNGLTGRWKGTYFENGVGNPRKSMKGAGTVYSPEARFRRMLVLERDLR